MPNLTSVGIAAGVPNSGTGTVSTIDQMLAQGVPISDGTLTNVVAIKGASTAPLATDKALVVALSPNSGVAPYPWTPATPSQKNVSITTAAALSVASGATMAQVQALGGPAYYTYDGVAPTSASFAGYLADGMVLTIQGAASLSAFQILGTSMSVAYFK